MKIGLSMIVKDEAASIVRCLDSVKPFIDYVLIEDTGSTDGTQRIILEWLCNNGVDGSVINEPWKDFAYNRTHALEKMRAVEDIDFVMVIDADDCLVVEDGFNLCELKNIIRTADAWNIKIKYGGIEYSRAQLFSNKLPFSYRGVIHEYLEVPKKSVINSITGGIHMVASCTGSRSKDAKKYESDATILIEALQSETDEHLRMRYTFYLAQSLKDCGRKEDSLEFYSIRADQGGWNEEIFVSLYQAAGLKEELGRPSSEIVDLYQRAAMECPNRSAEAYHAIARHCRLCSDHENAYKYASMGVSMVKPKDGLFVGSWVYEYGLMDEYAISAYWSGHIEQSLQACLSLLKNPLTPDSYRVRIAENAMFAWNKIKKSYN